MLRIRKRTSIEVVDQSAGSLVASLPAAVYNADLLLTVCFQGFDRFRKILGRPRAVLFINVFQRPRFLKHLIIDGHTVGRHADGELIIFPVAVPAGVADVLIDLI